MGAMLFKIIFLGAAACLGAGAGWWIRGGGSKAVSSDAPSSNPDASNGNLPVSSADPAAEAPKLDDVELMMAQLHQLTATVAADVGEHNSKVREINDELTAATANGSNILTVVEKLVRANEVMQSQLAHAESRLNEQAEEIETHVKEARTDSLTKLWNRRFFDDEIQKCKDALANSSSPSCVMMIDVDHFKKFNDTYGHQAGDEVLKGVARTLKRAAGKNLVCRYGGEEFAIIFPGLDIDTAIPTAESAREAIADLVVEFDGLDLGVTVSGGLAELQSAESTASVVARADNALYACKEVGRNCGYWHDGIESHPMKTYSLPTVDSKEAIPPTRVEFREDRRDRIVGVSDRATFQRDVDRRIAEWSRGGATLSILLVEIDEYDAIRELRGDKAREVVTRAASQFLKSAMRDMDHIARYRDRCFGLLLPGAEVTEASSVAERLRTAVEHCSLPIDGAKVTFTVSLGAAEVAENDTDATLLSRAESSLEAARESGGNCSFAATATGDVRSMAVSS